MVVVIVRIAHNAVQQVGMVNVFIADEPYIYQNTESAVIHDGFRAEGGQLISSARYCEAEACPA
jgi:hypothetical protein